MLALFCPTSCAKFRDSRLSTPLPLPAYRTKTESCLFMTQSKTDQNAIQLQHRWRLWRNSTSGQYTVYPQKWRHAFWNFGLRIKRFQANFLFHWNSSKKTMKGFATTPTTTDYWLPQKEKLTISMKTKTSERFMFFAWRQKNFQKNLYLILILKPSNNLPFRIILARPQKPKKMAKKTESVLKFRTSAICITPLQKNSIYFLPTTIWYSSSAWTATLNTSNNWTRNCLTKRRGLLSSKTVTCLLRMKGRTRSQLYWGSTIYFVICTQTYCDKKGL